MFFAVRSRKPGEVRHHSGNPGGRLECGRFGSDKSSRRLKSEKRGMPAKSKKQQMAAGAALAAKRGETRKSSLKVPSKKMAESMSKSQLEEFASAKRKKLPNQKSAK
jgi:hypothetical protein